MRIVAPLDLYSTARVTASTIAEPDTVVNDEQIYSATTTYAKNDLVIYVATHRVYQSLADGNHGNPLPDFTVGQTATAFWLDVGPDNKFAMFDYLRNSQTVGADGVDLVVDIHPGKRVNTVALLGLAGDTVTLEGFVDAVSVFGPLTRSIATREVTSWYEYFFTPFDVTPSVVFYDLPPEAGLTVRITIHPSTGAAKCGAVIMGQYVYVGDIEPAARNDALNFSTIDRDSQGNSVLIPRRSVPQIEVRTNADSSLINKLRLLRDQLNAVPALYAGVDTEDDVFYESLLILGIYKTFTINLTSPDLITVDLLVEEI